MPANPSKLNQAAAIWRKQMAPASPPRRVLALAWPAVLEQSLLALIALVDTFIVGHLGAAAIAGVGLGSQLFNLVNALFLAVGVGATALVARRVGARELGEANALGSQALLAGAGCGALTAVLVFVFAERVLRLLGAEPEVVRLGGIWLRLIAPSFFFTGLVVTGGAVLRGAGDMRASLLAVGAVNVVNVTLAWSLTRGAFGLPMLGVAGAGIATGVGQTIGGLIVLGMLLRGRAGLRLAPAALLRPDWSRIKRILNVGLPAAGEQLLLQLALVNMAAVITGLGTVAFAAHIIIIRLTGFSYLPGFGFSVAATTLVGQELGARRPDQARAAVHTALALSLTVMTAGALVIYFYDAAILRVFTDDQAVITAGVPIMRLAALAQPVIAAAFVFGGALRGAGDTRATMLGTVFSVWGLRVVLAYLFGTVLGLGLVGVWLAFNADWASRASLFWLRFRAGRWRTLQV